MYPYRKLRNHLNSFGAVLLFIGIFFVSLNSTCRKTKTGLNGTWIGISKGVYIDSSGVEWELSWSDKISFQENLPNEYTLNTGCTVQSPIVLKENDSLICDIPVDNCKRNGRISAKLFRLESKVSGLISTNVRVEYIDGGFPLIKYYPFKGTFTWIRK